MATWNEQLQGLRLAASLTQEQVAERAQFAVETVRRYEHGRGRPTRDAIIRLAQSLGADRAATNAVLTSAGREPLPEGPLARLVKRRVDTSLLARTVAAYSWPCLVVNDSHEIICWNEAAVQVAEMDFGVELPHRRQRNLLRIAVMPHFRERAVNWDEIMLVLMGILKGDNVEFGADTTASQYYASVIDDVVQQQPEVVGHLLTLWGRAIPQPEGVRSEFPVRWRVGDGTELRFNCILMAWSEVDGAFAFDWHPADRTTWEWLAGRTKLPLPAVPALPPC